jgi:transcription elongation factor GreA
VRGDDGLHRRVRAAGRPFNVLEEEDVSDAPAGHWLSPTAYKRLKREHERLTTVGRREVSDQIRAAREHGDVTDNADYEAAKERQGMMEARIRELDVVLKDAVVVDPSEHPASAVSAGMVVKIVRQPTGGEESYLVGSSENRGEGIDVVSPSSPLGAALLGRTVGETVHYEAPVGTLTVKVLEIRPFEG